jgi:intracellular sulfur oxidation DsrE/DsrF family protein
MKRTEFLVASALAAASGTIADADAIPGGSNFVERRAQFDMEAFDAVVGRPAKIRQVFEQVAFKPGMWNNVKNSFNGLQFGYGHAADEITIAVAGHGPSSAFVYTDYIWQKYKIGDYFSAKDAQGNTISSNIWLKAKAPFDTSADPDNDTGMYQDTSIETLQKRGVIVLACHTAIEEQAKGLVKAGNAPAGMTPKDVADDILTHLIPGALVNPSMVATVAVLQKVHGYTYVALTL